MTERVPLPVRRRGTRAGRIDDPPGRHDHRPDLARAGGYGSRGLRYRQRFHRAQRGHSPDRAGAAHHAEPGPVGDQRIRPAVRGADRHRGPAGRPARPQAHVHGRRRDLRPVLAAVRGGAGRRAAHRGCRARQHGRPAARRLAHRRGDLAAGVHREPPGDGVRRAGHPPLGPGEPARRRGARHRLPGGRPAVGGGDRDPDRPGPGQRRRIHQPAHPGPADLRRGPPGRVPARRAPPGGTGPGARRRAAQPGVRGILLRGAADIGHLLRRAAVPAAVHGSGPALLGDQVRCGPAAADGRLRGDLVRGREPVRPPRSPGHRGGGRGPARGRDIHAVLPGRQDLLPAPAARDVRARPRRRALLLRGDHGRGHRAGTRPGPAWPAASSTCARSPGARSAWG